MRIPSYSLYAKDAIGQALDIAAVKVVEDRAQRIVDYNMAVAEIWNILGYIDTEAYTSVKQNVTPAAGDITAHGTLDISTVDFAKWDKIIELEAFNTEDNSILYDCFKLSYTDFVRHKRAGGADEPYDESIVYSIVANTIHTLVGLSLTGITYVTVNYDIYFRRQPTVLLIASWDTEKVDLPDKYWSLLVNRIASLIEYRDGIFNKAMSMVKLSYEQLLSNVDPVIKASLLKSLDTPVGVLSE